MPLELPIGTHDELMNSFNKLVDHMIGIFYSKSYEYDSVVGLSVYYPFGRASVANSLGEKYHRYLNLIGVESTVDGRRDTLLDMAVVALLGLLIECNLNE